MKNFVKNKWLNEIIKIFLIIVGIGMMGLAFNSFFYANNIAPCGFGGLAAVISDLFVKLTWFYISPTLLYLLFNIVLIGFAFKALGKKYFFYSLFGILVYSVCIEYLNINIGLNDMFLASVFGSVLMGVGTGLVIRGGGSTGGGEMFGMILHHYNNDITVGRVIILVDSLVCVLNFAAHGLTSSLYTLIAIYLSGKITDFVIDGGKGTKAYYIISDKYQEISDAVLTKLYRGANMINGKGAYSKNDKTLLLCLVNKYEARNLKDIVFEIDDKAFLFSTSVVEAYGEGFIEEQRNRKKQKVKPKLFSKNKSLKKQSSDSQKALVIENAQNNQNAKKVQNAPIVETIKNNNENLSSEKDNNEIN